MEMQLEAKPVSTFGVAQIELEIRIQATPARVWEALVKETTHWWSKDFYTSPQTQRFMIEPKLGGHAYEDCGEGTGQIWYTVIGVHPPSSIMMQGLLTTEYGGPSHTILHLQLKPSGTGTTLQLSDTIFGKVGGEKLTQTREGWKLLFEDGLKNYVEQK
jgi:uncharacterized protein YndB with AHSA1/START domain